MAPRQWKLVRLVLVALAAGGAPGPSPRGEGRRLARRDDASERSHDAPLVHAPGGEVGRRPSRRQRPPRRDGVRETDEEEIPINENTYWSGGPYSTTVEGGVPRAPRDPETDLRGRARARPQGVRPRPDGLPGGAAEVPGARLGLASLPGSGEADGLPPPARPRDRDRDHALRAGGSDLHARGVRLARRPGDRGAPRADQPGKIAFRAQLRGARNQAHSNYATDYFRMDGVGTHGLVLRGKSADYLGVRGALRYEARLEAAAEAGSVRVEDDTLVVEGANAVTLFVAAATSFVTQGRQRRPRDTGEGRDRTIVGNARSTRSAGTTSPSTSVSSGACRSTSATTPDSALPTDERLRKFTGRQRPRAPRPPLPVRPVLLVSRRGLDVSRRTSRGLERGHQPHVGLQVHDEHQHGDELLAGRGRQPASARSHCSN